MRIPHALQFISLLKYASHVTPFHDWNGNTNHITIHKSWSCKFQTTKTNSTVPSNYTLKIKGSLTYASSWPNFTRIIRPIIRLVKYKTQNRIITFDPMYKTSLKCLWS